MDSLARLILLISACLQLTTLTMSSNISVSTSTTPDIISPYNTTDISSSRSGGSSSPTAEDMDNSLKYLASLLNMTVAEMFDYKARHNLTIKQMVQLVHGIHMVAPPVRQGPGPQDLCYCSGKVREIADSYRHIHGYVSLVVCLFGTVANALIVAVLTKKEMVGTSITRILTALAVADMLVMVEYVPFACYMYMVYPDNKDFPYSWAVFVLFHMHFTQLLHTISVCLTLALAVWRYIAIRYPQHIRVWCTDTRCRAAIVISYTLPFLVCSPAYFLFSICATTITENSEDVVLYHLGISELGKEGDQFLYYFNFWVHGVIMKLLPCLILTVISCWLIQALYDVNRRKQKLKGASCDSELISTGERRAISKSDKRTYRTTRMLLAVLVLFLITELPQGILGLLSGILGKCFFKECYHRFGEFMDILALLNGAINFILYCSMSRQFRTTFGDLFKPRNVLAKWAPPHTSVQSTYV